MKMEEGGGSGRIWPCISGEGRMEDGGMKIEEQRWTAEDVVMLEKDMSEGRQVRLRAGRG